VSQEGVSHPALTVSRLAYTEQVFSRLLLLVGSLEMQMRFLQPEETRDLLPSIHASPKFCSK
jgi:hypothetical protein